MQLSHTPNIILLNKQWTQVNLKLNSKNDGRNLWKKKKKRNLWLIIRLSWDMAPHRENWLPNTKTYWIYFGLYRQTIYMCVCVCIYIHIYLLLLLSRPVMSNSLRLHGLQHTRLPCPPLSLQFVKFMSAKLVMLLTNSSFVAPFSSCPQSFLAFRVFSNE